MPLAFLNQNCYTTTLIIIIILNTITMIIPITIFISYRTSSFTHAHLALTPRPLRAHLRPRTPFPNAWTPPPQPDRAAAGAGDGGATAVVEPKRVISSFGGLSGGRRRIRLGFGFGSRRIGSSIGGCDFLPLWIAGGE